MQYVITFLEGIVTFISPCILPLLPVYISFFTGGGTRSRKQTLENALGFVLGFTLVFLAMGAFAGSIGALIGRWRTAVNIITGCIVIFFGLSYLGIFRLPFFHGRSFSVRTEKMRPPAALVFGIVFSLSWTPCIGTFLGAALMMASNRASTLQGMLLLLLYSAGLGIPYVLSALLIDQLKGTISWIKCHYGVINRVCGILLLVIGIMMAAGIFDLLLRLVN